MAEEILTNGDNRFWYARGIVQEFLDKLWSKAIAPIDHSETRLLDFRGRKEDQDLLYLFVPDKAALASEGVRCTANDPLSLELEAPVLIDPRSDQTRLISYEKDEDACIAVAAGNIGPEDKERVKTTIDILGLNRRDRLNKKRNEFWDRCMMRIADYRQATGPQALRLIRQSVATAALKEMITYGFEFSSVSEACVRKNAPEPLIAAVFDV